MPLLSPQGVRKLCTALLPNITTKFTREGSRIMVTKARSNRKEDRSLSSLASWGRW